MAKQWITPLSTSFIMLVICSCRMYTFAIFLLLTHSYVRVRGWTAVPFNSPCLPLGIRSPYLNAWFNQGPASNQLNAQWPNLWTTTDPTVSRIGVDFYISNFFLSMYSIETLVITDTWLGSSHSSWQYHLFHIGKRYHLAKYLKSGKLSFHIDAHDIRL